MTAEPDLAHVAGTIGEPARAALPAALLRGLLTVMLLFGAAANPAAPLHAQGTGPDTRRDYGIGVAFFAAWPNPDAALPATDTLVIRRRASAGAPVVARFVVRAAEPYTWSYALEAGEERVESNAVEFGYEEMGLPIDSVAPGGDWVRVVYGVVAGRTPVRGWVRLVEGRIGYRLWAEVLAGNALFFLDGEGSAVFHDRPGGARVELGSPIAGAGNGILPDYRLDPLEVRGRWMKVRVVTPDDSCAAETVRTRERELWIEYLDARGRPRVWYHTRGC